MENKLSPNIEDYLEAIYEIDIEEDEVRVKDIAQKLEINPASVTEILYKMQDLDLTDHQRYGKVTLTDKGYAIAKKIYTRHRVLVEFLSDILGVDEVQAEIDSCKIEHTISDATMKRLVKFIEFIQKNPHGKPMWLKHFAYYLKENKYPPECLDK
ncbi:MAG: metal-dependent transcriptional regulator [Actinomycetota bacterium]|nr:metal-dependent transcriptional regulator [Actinomycetota bacterium]